VDLHNGFSRSHGIVVHVGVEKGKAPGRERFHGVGVEGVSHAEKEGALFHFDRLIRWVEVRWDAIAIRKRKFDGEWGGFPRVTSQCASDGRIRKGTDPQQADWFSIAGV